MTHVILIHGAVSNADAWFGIPAQLRAKGHNVDPVTLPGHGYNPFKLGADMDDYLAKVAEYLLPTEKAVLVGHSMGGQVISEFAAQHPDKISKLIYVTAFLPKEAETARQIMGRAGVGTQDILEEYEKHRWGTVLSAVTLQPPAPLRHPFTGGDAFADIPRHYLKCTDDGILKPDLQQSMIDAWPGTTVDTLDSDHIPQLTVPDTLAEKILEKLDN